MLAMAALYGWTILAGTVAAPALAMLGTQLATRDRALQTLCVAQGGMLGVLLGLGLSMEAGHLSAHLVPFSTAMLFSAGTYLGTSRLASARMASRSTFFAFVFTLLLAGGYLVSALFPALENHLTQIYLGDLATLTTSDAKAVALVFAVSLGFLLKGIRSISNRSFEWAVFGEPISTAKSGDRAFTWIALAMLCLSVQFLGFLFTVTALFLPTAVMSRTASKGMGRHFVLCNAVAVLGTVTGFALSLKYTRLPTVPTIAYAMFVFAGVIAALHVIQGCFVGRSRSRLLRRSLSVIVRRPRSGRRSNLGSTQ